MLFWNNGIKAVVVDGTNIADSELQPEYTVGIFPILRTPYRWGCAAVHSKTTYKHVCRPCLAYAHQSNYGCDFLHVFCCHRHRRPTVTCFQPKRDGALQRIKSSSSRLDCSPFTLPLSWRLSSFYLTTVMGTALLPPYHCHGDCSPFPLPLSWGLLSFPLTIVMGTALLLPYHCHWDCLPFTLPLSLGLFSFSLIIWTVLLFPF